MKRRVVSILTAAAMLVSASPTLASVGKIYTSDVAKKSATEKVYSNNGTFQQHTIQSGFEVSDDSNYYGALSYGIKSANVSKYGISILEGAFKANCVSFSSNGYIALGYNPSSNSGTKPVTADTLYNIGLIFKKDGKYDCYIDGEMFETGSIGTGDSSTTVALKFNQDGGGSHTIKNISWYKDFAGSQFAAQAEDAELTSQNSAPRVQK